MATKKIPKTYKATAISNFVKRNICNLEGVVLNASRYSSPHGKYGNTIEDEIEKYFRIPIDRNSQGPDINLRGYKAEIKSFDINSSAHIAITCVTPYDLLNGFDNWHPDKQDKVLCPTIYVGYERLKGDDFYIVSTHVCEKTPQEKARLLTDINVASKMWRNYTQADNVINKSEYNENGVVIDTSGNMLRLRYSRKRASLYPPSEQFDKLFG